MNTELLGATGPMWQPACASGVTWAGDCTHQAPASCSRCDGTGDDAWEARRASRWSRPEGRQVSRAEFMRPVEEVAA